MLLAGCASQSSGDADAALGTTSTPSTAAPDSDSTTTEQSTSSTTLVQPQTNEATTDPNQAPPTTETAGLSQSVESTQAPADVQCERLENFGDDSLSRWTVVNDEVMGGLSMGELDGTGSVVRFSGQINTNGGGFSLIRTSTLSDGLTLDVALADVDYLRFRVRSANGRRYELIAEDSTSPSQVMHFAPISVSDTGAWEELLVPLADLEARAFGNSGIDAAPFRIDQVTSIGVILADGLDGPFSLEIDRIDTCRA